MNVACTGTRPLLPWGGAKSQISINFNYNINFKGLLNKFYVSSHKLRVKTYHARFIFSRLGHAPGMRLRSTVVGMVVGPGVDFFTKFNKIWCVKNISKSNKWIH